MICFIQRSFFFYFKVTKVNDDLRKKVEDLQAEMKKFKAVFLKQENRIRHLETKVAELSPSNPEVIFYYSIF